jgi:hypothetical protein
VGRRKDTFMITNKKVSSIESSFRMENMQFDDECRTRVTNILERKISVSEALLELNKKYGVSAKKNERSRV